MDGRELGRGPRRSRHVAANSNNPPRRVASASNNAIPAPPTRSLADTDTGALQRVRHRQHTHVTVEAQNQGQVQTTPDQEQSGADAPPPNPFRLHRTNPGTQPRLSMPLLDSDDSDSEPDLSVLGRVRPGPTMETQSMPPAGYEDEVMSQDSVEETGDTSVEEQDDEDVDDGPEAEAPVALVDPASLGLKEISNLGKFTVSSHKQGNGVEELRSDDLKQYWQSDGPQPHKLTVYFVKRVGIRDIRFYVDYNEDESYTPTKIVFRSGTSENNLIEFATMSLDSPVGWQQVPLEGTGGDPDGNTLVSYVLQMQILENHQNGKDTHLRGIKIYAFDGDVGGSTAEDRDEASHEGQNRGKRDMSEAASILAATRLDAVTEGFTIPDFMKEPELR